MPENQFQTIGFSAEGRLATIELRRPPNNFFSIEMIGEIAEALAAADDDPDVRAVVLAAQGKAFCAGADLVRPEATASKGPAPRLYTEAVKLFRTRKPIVAAVHGAAIGGGLGLACVADFRVTCTEARFSANFTQLGFHPGFGLTAILPRLVGPQMTALLCYTGRRIPGDEAVRIGLADVLAPQGEVRAAAVALAQEIASSAPLAVISTRHTLRRGLADAVEAATERELGEQDWLRQTEDFREGVQASAARRSPAFQGR